SKRLAHDLLQLPVHFFNIPEEFLQVLHPLKIGDSHTTGIGQNVGNHEHIVGEQDSICPGSGGAVCGFGHNFCFDAVSVGQSDLVLQSGRDEHIAIKFQHIAA